MSDVLRPKGPRPRQTPASPAANPGIGPGPGVQSPAQAQAQARDWDPRDELIEELRARIQDLRRREEDLRAERDRLLQIIENQAEQLRALMPEPPSSNPRIGRWLALRYALFGR